MTIGLITGSGLEEFGLHTCTSMAVETTYGRVELQQAGSSDREIFLLRRHGPDHAIPPHQINYRANIRALRDVGCRIIIATNAVGALRQALKPGDIVLPDQFIDLTKARPTTFFDGPEVRHVDVTTPYCGHVRTQAAAAFANQPLALHAAGTYVCTEGPRFETPAEIKAYSQWGGDLVGMTGVPEVVLARELGMCYASVCLVTNFAAGLSGAPITEEEIAEIAAQQQQALDAALWELLNSVQDDSSCACHRWW